MKIIFIFFACILLLKSVSAIPALVYEHNVKDMYTLNDELNKDPLTLVEKFQTNGWMEIIRRNSNNNYVNKWRKYLTPFHTFDPRFDTPFETIFDTTLDNFYDNNNEFNTFVHISNNILRKVDKMDDPLVKKCIKKNLYEVTACELKAMKDWNIEGHEDPGSRSVCCSKWELKDCVEMTAQSNCNLTEIMALKKMLRNWEEKERDECKHFPYHSDVCKKTNVFMDNHYNEYKPVSVNFDKYIDHSHHVNSPPVYACNEVCNRGQAAIIECCRAHGYRHKEDARCVDGQAYCGYPW